jgi:uncharacterized protein with PIN domain
MKFIADAMLGRLARWLRLIGFDTLYSPDIDDRTLLKIALQEERYILTRDSHFRRKDIENCLFIKSDSLHEQIAQVVSELRLGPGAEMRCPNCNGTLKAVGQKETIRDSVPEYVYMKFNRFHQCSICSNVYWEGSHYRNFMKIIDKDLHGETT